jgi:hypothetical protein
MTARWPPDHVSHTIALRTVSEASLRSEPSTTSSYMTITCCGCSEILQAIMVHQVVQEGHRVVVMIGKYYSITNLRINGSTD